MDSLAQNILAATYLSGKGSAAFRGIAIDSHSSVIVGVIVGGLAGSEDFPLKNPVVPLFSGSGSSSDTVVAELNSDLTALLFSTFLSSSEPSGGTYFYGLAVDPADHPIVVGTTSTNDFPTTSNSYQPVPPPPPSPYQSVTHGFITKFDLSVPAPAMCLAQNFVDFGYVLVNSSGTQNLLIKNCGNAGLQISAISSSLTSVTIGAGCRTIASDSSCNLPLTYFPTDSNQVYGTLTFTDNAPISTQSVSLSGKGSTPNVYIPPSVQVNDLFLGTSAKSQLFFTNYGDGDWLISNISTSGDFSADNQCGTPLSSIYTGGITTCSIGIIFSPSAVGLRTGTLTISDNQPGSPHVIALSGNSLTTYPTPSITGIPAVASDADALQLVVYGTNFFPESQVMVNGSVRTTNYVYQANLIATLTPADLAQAGELSVAVVNPSPGGGNSNSFVATVYTAMRNIQFRDTVYDSISGRIFASVYPSSQTYAGQVVAIDPVSARVISAWTVGNGPNQLAISDDGQLLYVGLDDDKKVAQVAVGSGTVNFTVGLGNDPDFQNPMVADALRVLPGHPHAWVATLCGVGFGPCGEGVAVFDDNVQRANRVFENQLQSDSLLFIGQDTANLFGTTYFQSPPSFYQFAIDAAGVSLTHEMNNFDFNFGGGALDSDGTSIYVSNGQVIDPTTLTLKPISFSNNSNSLAFKVDVPTSHIYFSSTVYLFPSIGNFQIAAYDLATQQQTGLIPLLEAPQPFKMHRWGTNGLALSSQLSLLLFRTGITNSIVTPIQFALSGLVPNTVQAGSSDLSVTISGSGFAAGDTVTVNGTLVQTSDITPTQLNVTVPAALLSVPGDLQIAVSDTHSHVAYLTFVVSSGQTNVNLSTNVLNFPSQVVGTDSNTQNLTLTNSGSTSLTVAAVVATGDFSQTNNCTAVAPTGNCTITVKFTPTTAGNRSGALQITDSDASHMQTVALSGIGSDVQVTGGSGGTSSTVPSGQTASYNLTLTPQGGFTGAVTFSCTNLPQYAACNFSPPTATLGTSPVALTVSISTKQTQSATVINRGGATLTGLAFLMACWLGPLGFRGRSRHDVLAVYLAMTLVLLPIAGCGGGSSGGANPPPSTFSTPTGTYTVTLVITNAQITRNIPLTLKVQ